jgi:transcriptional regulator with XRE-family HTH domain
MTTTSQQPATISPVIQRRRLGAQLRDLPECRRLRLEDAAAALGVAPSTLSRIETGRAPNRTSYLTLLLDLYGITDKDQRRDLADSARAGQRKEWWWDDRDLLPAGTGMYLGLEPTALTVCSYSPYTIPDLLQTSDYTAALIRATRPGLTRRPDQKAHSPANQLRLHSVSGVDHTARQAGLEAIAAGWHDDPATLPWLYDRATTDTDGYVRQAAGQAIAADWLPVWLPGTVR